MDAQRVILRTYSGVQAEGSTLSRIETFSLKPQSICLSCYEEGANRPSDCGIGKPQGK